MPAQARSLVVHKFGGAALADAGAIAGVVRLLALDRTGTRRVVAASALMGVTDALVQAAATAASGDLDGALAAARELCARHQGVATELMLDSPAPYSPPRWSAPASPARSPTHRTSSTPMDAPVTRPLISCAPTYPPVPR